MWNLVSKLPVGSVDSYFGQEPRISLYPHSNCPRPHPSVPGTRKYAGLWWQGLWIIHRLQAKGGHSQVQLSSEPIPYSPEQKLLIASHSMVSIPSLPPLLLPLLWSPNPGKSPLWKQENKFSEHACNLSVPHLDLLVSLVLLP